jgi:hypothetical protein
MEDKKAMAFGSVEVIECQVKHVLFNPSLVLFIPDFACFVRQGGITSAKPRTRDMDVKLSFPSFCKRKKRINFIG